MGNKQICAYCGKETISLHFELCRDCIGIFGKNRKKWPAWLKLHVNTFEAERKDKIVWDARNKTIYEECTYFEDTGTYRIKSDGINRDLVKIVGDQIINLEDRQAITRELLYSGDPHEIEITRIAVKDALRELSPGEQNLIVLYYWRGLKQAEIARRLNISQAEVSKQLDDTIRKLRESFILE